MCCKSFETVSKTTQRNSHLFKSKASISATTSRLLQDCNPMLPTKIFLLTRMILMTFQAKMLHYAFGHAFGLVILCFAMLLTQYAPKTRIIMLLVKSYFVLPCFFWHNMLQQLISHFLGQKWNLLFTVTIHLSLFTITIHCYYSPVTIHSKFLPI